MIYWCFKIEDVYLKYPKGSKEYENLEYYKTRNIVETYNAFSRNFHTHGNMNLINESFHRTRLLGQLRVWLMNGLSHFDL